MPGLSRLVREMPGKEKALCGSAETGSDRAFLLQVRERSEGRQEESAPPQNFGHATGRARAKGLRRRAIHRAGWIGGRGAEFAG